MLVGHDTRIDQRSVLVVPVVTLHKSSLSIES
jgi:hypothetical protein